MALSIYASPSNPDPGQTVRCYWRFTNGWSRSYSFKIEFYLNDSLIKTENLGTLSPGESKEGSFSFSAPSEEGEYTLKAVSYLYFDGKWTDEDETTFKLIVGKICTKEEFRNGMVNAYKDIAVDWETPYCPIIDVTEKVVKVKKDPFIYKALLTIHGANLYNIRVQGPYDSLPPALTDEQVVANWEKGEEWERQYCSRNGKYYWVIYPCDLKIFRRHLVVDVEPKVAAPGNPVKITWYHRTNLRRTLFRIYIYLDDSLIKKYEFYQSWGDGTKSESFTISAPTVPGTHTVKAVLWRYDEEEDRWIRRVAEYSTTFEVREVPVTSWTVSVDKPTVSAGDTLKIIAKVNWEAPGSLKFKLSIDAFGKHYESKEVIATASPTVIEAPITVPPDVKEGKYDIKVTLYYE